MAQAGEEQAAAAFAWQQRKATPDSTPELVSILSTAELRRRPSRPPDHAAENRALVALAQEMAISPDGILQKLAETALVLCRAHSAGLSLLEDDDQRSNFHWRAIAGQWAPHVNGGTPRNFGPCGTVLGPQRCADVFTPRARLSLLRRGHATSGRSTVDSFLHQGGSCRHNLDRRPRRKSPLRRGRPACDDQPG